MEGVTNQVNIVIELNCLLNRDSVSMYKLQFINNKLYNDWLSVKYYIYILHICLKSICNFRNRHSTGGKHDIINHITYDNVYIFPGRNRRDTFFLSSSLVNKIYLLI
jgi:hypothetical protein